MRTFLPQRARWDFLDDDKNNEADDGEIQTCGHKFQNKLRIGNIAASEFILTDFEAHVWVRTGHFICKQPNSQPIN